MYEQGVKFISRNKLYQLWRHDFVHKYYNNYLTKRFKKMVLQTKYFFVDTSRSSLPYGTKFLRVLMFAIFSRK